MSSNSKTVQVNKTTEGETPVLDRYTPLDPNAPKVTIWCIKDDTRVEVPVRVAKMSGLLRVLLELDDDNTTEELPLEKVSAEDLTIILEWMRHHAEYEPRVMPHVLVTSD